MRPRIQRLSSAYTDWWLNGYSPLHGGLRFFFYAALFYLAMRNLKSPLAGIGFYEMTDPRLFQVSGLLELLRIQYIDPAILQVIIIVTTIAWLLAAVGLLTRVSMIVTALGALFLQGVFLATNALNHYWFLPVYAMIALCFTDTRDRWSLDYYLWGARPNTRQSSLLETGFARQLVLVLAVGFYFAAGVSKLATTGLGWADGHLIQYFAETRRNVYPLAAPLADNLWLCQLLAIGSLVLEAGAPIALVSRRLRFAFVCGWIMMHLGIRYVMGPGYWPNIVVLCLLVEWQALATIVKNWFRLVANASAKGMDVATSSRSLGQVSTRGRFVASFLGSLVILVLLIPSVGQVTWWPFTSVYMYSPYFSVPAEVRAGYPRGDYDDMRTAQAIARTFVDTRPNKEATEYMCYRGGLRLVRDGAEPLYLFDSLGVADWKQWALTIGGPVVIADLADKPQGQPAFDPRQSNYPAQEFLKGYVEVLRDHLPDYLIQQYDRVELVYVLGDKTGKNTNRVPDEFWDHCTPELNRPPNSYALPLASVSLREHQESDEEETPTKIDRLDLAGGNESQQGPLPR